VREQEGEDATKQDSDSDRRGDCDPRLVKRLRRVPHQGPVSAATHWWPFLQFMAFRTRGLRGRGKQVGRVSSHSYFRQRKTFLGL
jgi:hypothetical protein